MMVGQHDPQTKTTCFDQLTTWPDPSVLPSIVKKFYNARFHEEMQVSLWRRVDTF